MLFVDWFGLSSITAALRILVGCLWVLVGCVCVCRLAGCLVFMAVRGLRCFMVVG